MDGGYIGRLRTKNQIREFHADRDCLFRDLPLAVLVGNRTTGEGEWVAAALRESGQALVIGRSSGGTAFDRTTVILTSGDGLRLATGVFEPGGKPYEPRAKGREQASEAGILLDAIGQLQKLREDALSNTVNGERVFSRPGDLDPIVAEAVRQLQMAIHAGRGRAVRQPAVKHPD
jgi:hypothetical protein